MELSSPLHIFATFGGKEEGGKALEMTHNSAEIHVYIGQAMYNSRQLNKMTYNSAEIYVYI